MITLPKLVWLVLVNFSLNSALAAPDLNPHEANGRVEFQYPSSGSLPLLNSFNVSLEDNPRQDIEEKKLSKLISKAEALSVTDPQRGVVLADSLYAVSLDLGYTKLAELALFHKASSLFNQSNYNTALDVLEDCAQQTTLGLQYELKINYLMSVCQYFLGLYTSSISLILKNLETEELAKDDSAYVRHMRFLGEVYRAADNLEPALKYLQDALKLSEEIQDTLSITYCLNRIGVIYYKRSEHWLAENFLKDSYKLSMENNFESLISMNLNDLGELYFATQEYEKSIGLLEDALKISKSAENRINTLNNIARLNWKLEKYDAAIKNSEEALVLADEIGLLTFKVDATKIIADSYRGKREFSKATDYYNVYIAYADSLFKKEQNRQVVELETKYKTEQKEQQIAALQEKEAADREKRQLYLTMLIAAIFFLLILVGLFIKIRNNNDLIIVQNDRLEQLNATKDKFFSIVAHDLRSPMIGLQGMGQKLEYFIKRDRKEKLLEIGNQIDVSVDHLNHLLNNLLNWAVAQTDGIPHNPDTYILKELLEENLALYQSLIESKDIMINTQFQEGATIYADINSLSAILRNLLSNAIKFSPRGGTITIITEIIQNTSIIKIGDQGQGMSEARVTKLFTADLKSTDGELGEKGFGLGLKLCREFVQKNKGEINVKSVMGTGTTFIVQLPARAAAEYLKFHENSKSA